MPQYVVEKCRKQARKADPVKITYNFGTLKLDYGKSLAEVSRDCKDRAAGCFHGGGSCYWSYDVESIPMENYTCYFPKAHVNCDFSGSSIDVTGEYTGCKFRAVLRHELQHFLNWKTANDNMIREMKTEGNKLAVQEAKVCSEYCDCSAENLVNMLRKIYRKWDYIKSVNDGRLDEIDHDHDTEVNYKVCDPYSFEIISY